MKLLVITGSRADFGPLEWLVKCLQEDAFFDCRTYYIPQPNFAGAYQEVADYLLQRPDMVLLLGDRYEILAAAIAAHLQRIPIAHIGGGDVTLGSYDDAMRDCISRMATIHFATSAVSEERLHWLLAAGGTNTFEQNVFLVGSPGVDYIMHADWKRERPIAEPYVVVSYQAETIDGTVDLEAVRAAIGARRAVWITPNPDAGNEAIPKGETYAHAEFLNLLAHCEEFIGNSSAMLYEAPFMGVKCRMIGKRQRGRVQPFGDGRASERIIEVLKEWRP